MGQEKLILGHNKMKYGTEQGHFLGQEKLTYGDNMTNFGTKQGDFLGQEKSILDLFKMNMGHNDVFFGEEKLIFGSKQDELWDIRM